MNNNVVVKDEKIKKVTEYKGFKVAIGLLIAIVVAFIAVFVAFGIFNSVVNNVSEQKASGIMVDLTMKAMPKSIVSEDGKYTFYCEKNEEFDGSVDNMADFVKFYYLDGSENKVYIENATVKTDNGEEMNVLFGFLHETIENLNDIKAKIASVLAFLGVAVVGLIIWASYYVYAYNEDKKALVKAKDKSNKNTIENK